MTTTPQPRSAHRPRRLIPNVDSVYRLPDGRLVDAVYGLPVTARDLEDLRGRR